MTTAQNQTQGEAGSGPRPAVPSPQPRVIAIASGKGGVGKSSVAVNLGIALARRGRRVCIFDADTGLANVNILLGLAPKQTLEHVLFGACSIEEIMLEGPHGLRVIPGANGISQCADLHPRQQLRLARELARVEQNFDYLLLDTAAGIAASTLDFICSAHTALVVITPEPTSLTDAFSLVKLLQRRRRGLDVQVLVNMCSSTNQAREIFHRFSAAVEKYIGLRPRYFGFLLRDESLRAAVTLQSPVALFPETDPSSRSFLRLAETLEQSMAAEAGGVGFSGFWLRQFRASRGGEASSTKRAPAAKGTEDGVAELAPRLRQLIARSDDREALAGLVREVHDAYLQRFGTPAVDPLRLLVALTESPERDDVLLRQLAQQLAPWLPEPEPPVPMTLPVPPAVAPSPGQPAVPSPSTLAHGFDAGRYGSQELLLERLRQQRDDRSLLELIDLL